MAQYVETPNGLIEFPDEATPELIQQFFTDNASLFAPAEPLVQQELTAPEASTPITPPPPPAPKPLENPINDDLLNAIIQTESSGNPRARNARTGAMGLMQVMPQTAHNPGYGIEPVRRQSDLLNPEINVRFGTQYLNAMYDKYGDIDLALAAYNAGPGQVDRWLDQGLTVQQFPGEVRNYVNKINSLLPQPVAQGGIPTDRNEIVGDLSTRIPPGPIPEALVPVVQEGDTGWQIGRGFMRAIGGDIGQNYGSFFAGVGRLVGSPDLERYGQDIAQGRKDWSNENYLPAVKNWEDAKTFDQKLDWFSYAIGQGFGQMIESAGVATGAAAVAKAFPPTRAAAVTVGATAAGLNSYALSYGSLYDTLIEKNVDPDHAAKVAAIYAAPIAALDSIVPAQAAKIFFGEPKEKLIKNYIARAVTEGMKGMRDEGITEGAQTAIEKAAITGETGEQFWSKATAIEIALSSAVGAVVGGGTKGTLSVFMKDKPGPTKIDVNVEPSRFDGLEAVVQTGSGPKAAKIVGQINLEGRTMFVGDNGLVFNQDDFVLRDLTDAQQDRNRGREEDTTPVSTPGIEIPQTWADLEDFVRPAQPEDTASPGNDTANASVAPTLDVLTNDELVEYSNLLRMKDSGQLNESQNARLYHLQNKVDNSDISATVNPADINKIDAFNYEGDFTSTVAAALNDPKLANAKMSAAQWYQTLRNRPGVSQNEMTHTGLIESLEFLTSNDEPNPRQWSATDIMDYLRQGELKTRVYALPEKGGLNDFQHMHLSALEPMYDKLAEDVAKEHGVYKSDLASDLNDAEPGGFVTSDEDRAKIGAAQNDLRQRMNTIAPNTYEQFVSLRRARDRTVAKYKYVLPGDENYREVFVTADGVEADKGWVDGHSNYNNIPNPIVRLRLSDRTTPDGKRTMFVEELQQPTKGQFHKMPKWAQENWLNIGVKQALMLAAEGGYDRVSWTPAEVQRSRWRHQPPGPLRKLLIEKNSSWRYSGKPYVVYGWMENSIKRDKEEPNIERAVSEEEYLKMFGHMPHVTEELEAMKDTFAKGHDRYEIYFEEGSRPIFDPKPWVHNIYDRDMPRRFKEFARKFDKKAEVTTNSIVTERADVRNLTLSYEPSEAEPGKFDIIATYKPWGKPETRLPMITVESEDEARSRTDVDFMPNATPEERKAGNFLFTETRDLAVKLLNSKVNSLGVDIPPALRDQINLKKLPLLTVNPEPAVQSAWEDFKASASAMFEQVMPNAHGRVRPMFEFASQLANPLDKTGKLSAGGLYRHAGYRLSTNLVQMAMTTPGTPTELLTLHELTHHLDKNGFYTPDERAMLYDRPENYEWMLDLASKNIDRLTNRERLTGARREAVERYKQQELAKGSEVLTYAMAEYYTQARESGDIAAPGSKLRNVTARQLFNRFVALMDRIRAWWNKRGYDTPEKLFRATIYGDVFRRQFDAADPAGMEQMRQGAVITGSKTLEEFKRWFGNSAVTNSMGHPQTVYRSWPTYAKSGADPLTTTHEIAGPGVYWTDNMTHAETWGRSEGEVHVLREQLEETRIALQGAKDMFREAVRIGDLAAAQAVEQIRKFAEQNIHDIESRLKEVGREYGQHMVPAFLAIKNPLYDHMLLTPGMHKAIRDAIKTAPLPRIIRDDALARYDAEHFTSVHDIIMHGDKIMAGALNRVARKMDYDGISFRAGEGNRVWVSFNPGQFRSAYPNDGSDVSASVAVPSTASPGSAVQYSMTAQNNSINRRNTFWSRANPFEKLKDINAVSDWLLSPRHVASTNSAFTAVYQIGEDGRARRSTDVAEASQRLRPYASLTDSDRAVLDAGIELARLQGLKLVPNRNGEIIVANQYGDTDLTKYGDVIAIPARLVPAYMSLQDAGDYMLNRLREAHIEATGQVIFGPRITGGHTVKLQIPTNFTAAQVAQVGRLLDQLAQNAPSNEQKSAISQEADKIKKLAEWLVHMEMLQKVDYVPFSRFGEWGVVLEDPQTGKRVHFETFEGTKTKAQRVMNRGKIEARIRELQQRYPGSVVRQNVEVQAIGPDGLPLMTMYPRAQEVGVAQAKLLRQFPGARITVGQPSTVFRLTFDAVKEIAGGGIATIDFMVGMLGSQSQQDYANMRDALARMFAERGFPTHLANSEKLPGYSSDFKRAWANYTVGTASYVNRLVSKPKLEEAIGRIPQRMPRLLKYAQRYADDAVSANEEWAFLRSLGFMWYLAGNMSSAILQLANLPVFAQAHLAQFIPAAKASYYTGKTFTRIMRMVNTTMLKRAGEAAMAAMGKQAGQGQTWDRWIMFDPTHPDVAKQVSPDEQRILRRAHEDGTTKPLLSVQQIGLTPNLGTTVPTGVVAAWQGAQSFLASAFGTLETASRATQLLTYYRVARDNPGVLLKAQQVFANNPLWQAEWSRAVSPEDQMYLFAKFSVDEVAGQFNRGNRARYQRGVGALINQFASWLHLILETLVRMGKDQGLAGKKGVGLVFIALWAVGGVFGLPGGDNWKDLFEWLYRKITGEDLDVETTMRKEIVEFTDNTRLMDALQGAFPTMSPQILAEWATRGPLRSIIGTDLSRRAALNQLPMTNVFKAIFGDSNAGQGGGSGTGDLLGPIEAATFGSFDAMNTRVKIGGEDPVVAARELLPTAFKNLAEAEIWATDGYRTRAGNKMIDAKDITDYEVWQKRLGFTPTKMARAAELARAQKRAAEQGTDAGKVWRARAVRIQEKMARAHYAGDDRAVAELSREWNKLVKAREEYNATQPPSRQIQLDSSSIRQMMREAALDLNPRLRQIVRAPRAKRGEVRGLQDVYPDSTGEDDE